MAKEPPKRLLELQRRFAGHLRDPDNVPPPDGIEDRRLAIYRRLFFNNLSNLFARNFPVIRKLHDDESWQAIIRKFMTQHRSSTPMFTEIGGEFVEFIVEQSGRNQPIEQSNTAQPWLAELAHWEYLETCVRLDGAKVITAEAELESGSAQNLLTEPILVNPTLQLAQYQWPVHRIGPVFQPTEPEPIMLAVFRRANDKVEFMQVNALTTSLLQQLNAEDAPTLAGVLDRLAERIQQPAETLREAALPLINTLLERELILGSRNVSSS